MTTRPASGAARSSAARSSAGATLSSASCLPSAVSSRVLTPLLHQHEAGVHVIEGHQAHARQFLAVDAA